MILQRGRLVELIATNRCDRTKIMEILSPSMLSRSILAWVHCDPNLHLGIWDFLGSTERKYSQASCLFNPSTFSSSISHQAIKQILLKFHIVFVVPKPIMGRICVWYDDKYQLTIYSILSLSLLHTLFSLRVFVSLSIEKDTSQKFVILDLSKMNRKGMILNYFTKEKPDFRRAVLSGDYWPNLLIWLVTMATKRLN